MLQKTPHTHTDQPLKKETCNQSQAVHSSELSNLLCSSFLPFEKNPNTLNAETVQTVVSRRRRKQPCHPLLLFVLSVSGAACF